jgi:rubrerythrin
MAQEAEQTAARTYSTAAHEATNPLVRRLFQQLAEFEDLHYAKLVELEESLRAKGKFLPYDDEPRLAEFTPGEIVEIGTAQKTSASKVLKLAMEAETKAEARYQALAERTADPDGRRMFASFAKEEHSHFEVLRRAYYEVANLVLPA